MATSEYAWFNGVIGPTAKADPSVASNTLHLGIAVFDGIMAYHNDDHWYVHRLDEHLRRFCAGADRMDLGTPWRPDDIASGIAELLDTLPPRTHYLRPIAYRTGSDVFFQPAENSASVCVFAVPVARDQDEPYSCQLSPIRRLHHRSIPVSWKISGAYANSYLAEREALAAGYDTGVLLDGLGRVAEASAANIFFVTGDTLVTPLLDGDVFPGITRAMLLECAASEGIPVVERNVWPFQLADFDAAFICGTLTEIRPVDRLGPHRYRSSRHPLFRRLLATFRAATHQ